MQRLQVRPPFVPENHVIHAQTIAEVGEFDSADLKKIKYTEEDDLKYYKDFAYVNREAFYEEVVAAFKKELERPNPPKQNVDDGACCVLS